MMLSREATALLAEQKERILEALRRAPTSKVDIPRRWPVTRGMVTYLLEQLEMEGRIMVVARDLRTGAKVWGLNPWPSSALPAEPYRLAS